MSILIDDGSRVLVQGITGREGEFHTERMIRYGTRVVGGVTPGRGGQPTLGVPVFCLGVPTVLDAGTLGGPRGMIVTPRDIDAQVRFLGRVAADAVNLALHPEISYDDFAQFIPHR